MNILIQLWAVQSPQQAGELRCKAERHAVEDDAAKLLRLSLALDRLLETGPRSKRTCKTRAPQPLVIQVSP